MTGKPKETCRWITKKGVRCKNRAVGNTGFCVLHSVTIRFKTQIIIATVSILVGAIVTLFGPNLIRIIIPEKTLLEMVKTEGERAIRIEDKTQVPVHAHNLCDLGLLSLKNRDFVAYKEAIWQLLRVHTLSWINQWPPRPEEEIARNEVNDQLIKLITTERLSYLGQRVEISRMLGDVAVAGTEGDIKEYNLGNFFSDNLFTETLEDMRRIIDKLWMKGDTEFAHFVFEVMRDVILAEANRRLDQGYRIWPLETDKPYLTSSGQRIADVGQPRDLDSYYRACRILSRVPEPLLKEFLTSDYYYHLSYMLNVDESIDGEQKCTPEDVRKWRYYGGGIFLLAVSSSAESLVIDSLISSCNHQRQVAADCVKQLVKRERYPSAWKNN